MKNLFMILIAAFMLFGCKGEDGKDGKDGIDGKDGQDTVYEKILNPSGKAEAGPCYLLSDVSTMSMNTVWVQSEYILGSIEKNDGSFTVPGAFVGPFLVYDFDGTCYSEGDNMDRSGVRMKMGQAASATSHNINHATTWRYHLAKRYFQDPAHPAYQDIVSAFVTARTDIYNYLGFPNATANFYELSIAGNTLGDAYLFAFEAAVTTGRNGPEQGDYIGQAVNAVNDNDLTFRNDLREVINNIPVYQTWNNLKNKFASLGFSIDPAPLYNLPIYPDYYKLMDGTTDVQGVYNMDTTGLCSIDVSDRNLFAVPYIFESWIETSDYLALNISGGPTVSIWSHHVDGYDRPYQKISDIETMREILLEDPEKLAFNGVIGTPITAGENVYLVFEYPENVAFSKGCTGEMVKFGRILASNDGGLNWIGWDNVTPWFNRFGLKVVGVSK